MVGLGILTVSLFIALIFAAYKYEQLETDLYETSQDLRCISGLYDGLIMDYYDSQEIIDMLAEAEVAALYPKEVNE